MSDESGTWPISKPTITRGSQVSRQLVVFNDTLSGTGVDVSWQMHQDSATGPMSDQGSMHLEIPLAGHAMITANVTAATPGTTAVLVLQSSKDGTVLFLDDGELFTLQQRGPPARPGVRIIAGRPQGQLTGDLRSPHQF